MSELWPFSGGFNCLLLYMYLFIIIRYMYLFIITHTSTCVEELEDGLQRIAVHALDGQDPPRQLACDYICYMYDYILCMIYGIPYVCMITYYLFIVIHTTLPDSLPAKRKEKTTPCGA